MLTLGIAMLLPLGEDGAGRGGGGGGGEARHIGCSSLSYYISFVLESNPSWHLLALTSQISVRRRRFRCKSEKYRRSKRRAQLPQHLKYGHFFS
jgi:hypothetical protein